MQRSAVPERSSFLEVRKLVSGKNTIAQVLNGLLLPRSDFAPMEFLAVVSSAGLVGDPVLVTGSGVGGSGQFLPLLPCKIIQAGRAFEPWPVSRFGGSLGFLGNSQESS